MACLVLLYFYVVTSEEPGPESYLEFMDEIKRQKQNTPQSFSYSDFFLFAFYSLLLHLLFILSLLLTFFNVFILHKEICCFIYTRKMFLHFIFFVSSVIHIFLLRAIM
jgi:hypothetical protein